MNYGLRNSKCLKVGFADATKIIGAFADDLLEVSSNMFVGMFLLEYSNYSISRAQSQFISRMRNTSKDLQEEGKWLGFKELFMMMVV